MAKKANASQPSFWDIKVKRQYEFTVRFVAEHHPGMADVHKIKGAHPLVPLAAPGFGLHSGWWFQTDDSMAALGAVYINHLFQRHKLRDHEWMIGRGDQEPWALVSEPYDHGHGRQAEVKALRRDLERVGVELLEYPPEQSTHNPPRGILVLVANVLSVHTLMGEVARLILADCPPPRVDEE